MSQLCQAGCVQESELTTRRVCSEMHQCILRLISMSELALCLEVLCVAEWSISFKLVLCVAEWSISFKLVDRCSTCYKNAIRQVQLLLPFEPRIFKYLMHIYMYFNDTFPYQGNSHVSHNRNQTNVTIMGKKTSRSLHQFGVCVVRLVLACSVFGEAECKRILL